MKSADLILDATQKLVTWMSGPDSLNVWLSNNEKYQISYMVHIMTMDSCFEFIKCSLRGTGPSLKSYQLIYTQLQSDILTDKTYFILRLLCCVNNLFHDLCLSRWYQKLKNYPSVKISQTKYLNNEHHHDVMKQMICWLFTTKCCRDTFVLITNFFTFFKVFYFECVRMYKLADDAISALCFSFVNTRSQHKITSLLGLKSVSQVVSPAII